MHLVLQLHKDKSTRVIFHEMKELRRIHVFVVNEKDEEVEFMDEMDTTDMEAHFRPWKLGSN